MWRDPLGPVADLGRRQETTSAAVGIIGALLLHGGVASGAATSLTDMSAFVQLAKAHVLDRLLQTYDIEVEPPKPPEPPPPPPEKLPELPLPVEKEKVLPQQKPAAAQAAKILAAEPDPNAPLDLTDQGFVSGTGDNFAGGVTSSAGTSKVAVRDTAAQGAGVAGTPEPPKAPPSLGPDRSRAARPASMEWHDCPFPPQAEVEQIDYGRVSISVTVAPDGRALKVTVLSNPGYGFGQAALSCAMRRKFMPALNRDGQPITQSTPPISVTFTR